MKNLQSVKTLASQTAAMGVSTKNYNPRKQPISVSQQFQQSLHSLMVTLNQANPFFIRCIKSNSEKVNAQCPLCTSAEITTSFCYLVVNSCVCGLFIFRVLISSTMSSFKDNYAILVCWRR